jgi:hypothetical protein
MTHKLNGSIKEDGKNVEAVSDAILIFNVVKQSLTMKLTNDSCQRTIPLSWR